MTFYPNLPDRQQGVQRLIEKFNADEAFWQRLEERRRLRRKALHRLTKKQRQILDMIEFIVLRPLDDCIGLEVK